MKTAAETAAEVVAELKKSGPPQGGWTVGIERLLASAKGSLAPGGKVDFSDFFCFEKGCAVTATHPDLGSLQSFSSELRRSEAFLALNSPWFRSGPIELPSGQVKAQVRPGSVEATSRRAAKTVDHEEAAG